MNQKTKTQETFSPRPPGKDPLKLLFFFCSLFRRQGVIMHSLFKFACTVQQPCIWETDIKDFQYKHTHKQKCSKQTNRQNRNLELRVLL